MTRRKDQPRQKLRDALTADNKRYTVQRAHVFEALLATDQHPTAEEVYRKIKPTVPTVSLATVYKALDALVRCGLAQKLTNGDGSARFDADVTAHPHLRDLTTGRILDLPHSVADGLGLTLGELALQRIREETGFQVTALRIELVGHLGQPSPA